MSVILFSQLKFDTGESVEATVVSTGIVEGVTGKEVYLVVETDDGVSAKVDGNRSVSVDDRVVLNVYNRFLFRDIYRLK